MSPFKVLSTLLLFCALSAHAQISKYPQDLQRYLGGFRSLKLDLLEQGAEAPAFSEMVERLSQADAQPLTQTEIERWSEFVLTGARQGPDSREERRFDAAHYRLAYAILYFYLDQHSSPSLVTLHQTLKRRYIESGLRYVGSFVKNAEVKSILKIFWDELNLSSSTSTLEPFNEKAESSPQLKLKIYDLNPKQRATLDRGVHAGHEVFFNSRNARGAYTVKAAYERKTHRIYLDFSQPFTENIIELTHELTHAVDPRTRSAMASLFEKAPQVQATLARIAKQNHLPSAKTLDIEKDLLRPYFFDQSADGAGSRSEAFEQTVKYLAESVRKDISNEVQVDEESARTLSEFFALLVDATVGNEYRAYRNSLVAYFELVESLGAENLNISPEEFRRIRDITHPGEAFLVTLFMDYGRIFEMHAKMRGDGNAESPLTAVTAYFFFRTVQSTLHEYSADFQQWTSQIPPSALAQDPQIREREQDRMKLYIDNTFNVLSRKLSALWVEHYQSVAGQSYSVLNRWNADVLLFSLNVVRADWIESELSRLYPPINNRTSSREDIAALLRQIQEMQTRRIRGGNDYTPDQVLSMSLTHGRDSVLSQVGSLAPELKEALIGVRVFLEQIQNRPDSVDPESRGLLSKLLESRDKLASIQEQLVAVSILSERLGRDDNQLALNELTDYLERFFTRNSFFRLTDRASIKKKLLAQSKQYKRELDEGLRKAPAQKEMRQGFIFTTQVFAAKSVQVDGRYLNCYIYKKKPLCIDFDGTQVWQNTTGMGAKGATIGFELQSGTAGVDEIRIKFQ